MLVQGTLKNTPLKAIRLKCIDCSGFELKDVRECVFDGKDEELCPLYHLRMGKGSRTTLKAIRSYCLWCCIDQKSEVTLCPATKCSLWVYRFGHRPQKSNLLSKKSLTAGVLEAGTRRG